uniref:F-box and leucine-rich repeat protein 22 n=1 Tax=Neogobius melanostomus TaxID=47308 RepID=A0A8C6SN93_9GOBI
MHLTQLNQQCLLHVFSFLDKDNRSSLSQTCVRLREVFLDPCLWTRLHFSSPSQLRQDNFILGPSLRYLTISWHSSRVQQVCNIEDWLKSSFQKDICSKHQSLVTDFLQQVCHKCPNLLLLSLSGCAHISDQDVLSVLRSCPRLRCLFLENCVRITDSVLEGVVTYGSSLQEVRVDFCRNVSQSGLQRVRESRPELSLRAERSARMIPDSLPEERENIRKTLQKVLVFS